MTLQDVADAINAQTSTTNVQASIVQVSSGSFELVLTGTQDAADISYSSTSGDDILNKLGVTDSTGAFSERAADGASGEIHPRRHPTDAQHQRHHRRAERRHLQSPAADAERLHGEYQHRRRHRPDHVRDRRPSSRTTTRSATT